MKYLFYIDNQNPIAIRLTDLNNKTIIADDEYSIKELFELKQKKQYTKIEIMTMDLFEKEKKQSKFSKELHGYINIMEYELGGKYKPTNRWKI